MEDILNKLRNQSDRTKKIMVWVIVALLGLLLLAWWVNNWKTKIEKLNTGQIEIQKEIFNGAALNEIINRFVQ